MANEIDGDKSHSQKVDYDNLRDTHLRMDETLEDTQPMKFKITLKKLWRK